METDFKISDMYVLELQWDQGILTVLKEDDHLLRRFGQIDLVNLTPGGNIEVWREKADEIWILFSGEAKIVMEDLRDESPSLNDIVELTLDQDHPKAVLVPFGVKFKLYSSDGAMLLRVGTHQDNSLMTDQTP